LGHGGSKEGRETGGISTMAKDKSTGFVVKLYQMVNGAPDDILSVSSFFVDEGCFAFCNCIGYCEIAA
jgi:hypothetical protein